MSIFKDTLKQYVQDQLNAREIVTSQGQYVPDPNNPGKKYNKVSPYGLVPRDDKFLRYVAGKNAWVKMQSFVDCYAPIFNNNNEVTGYEGVKIGTKTYKGSELARKYILEGGTLFEEKDDQ